MGQVTDDRVNRFLTLSMGECWHDLDLGSPVLTCKGGGFVCRRCRDLVVSNYDFGVAEDFLKLLRWIDANPALKTWMVRIGGSPPGNRAERTAFAERLFHFLSDGRPAG